MQNLQIKEGTAPLWLCGSCLYTTVATPDKTCYSCDRGHQNPPDLSFIKEMSRSGRSIHSVLKDSNT